MPREVTVALWMLLCCLGFRCSPLDHDAANSREKDEVQEWLDQGENARHQGNYREALKLFEQACQKLEEEAVQSENPASWAEVVSCLNQMAWDHMVYFGAFAESEKLLLRAGELAAANLPEKHRETLRQLHNLAVLRYYENRLEEALALNQELLVLRESLTGDQRRTLAATHNNLGLVYRARGELAKAEFHYQRGLDLKRDALGDDHIDLANSYQNLGVIQRLLGEFDPGLMSLRRAYELRTQHKAKNHPDIGASAFTLGKALLDSGELAQASRLIEESIRIKKAAYGDDHPHTAHSSWEYSRILVSRGLFDEAEVGLKQALGVFEKHFGRGNYHLADNLHYLGWLYWKKGDFEQSLQYFHKALAVFEDNDAYRHGWLSVADEAKIRCYRAIATVGISRYLNDPKPQHLEDALAAIHQANRILTRARRRVLTEATQLVMARQGRDVLSLGVDIAMELYEKTADMAFLEQAFLFAEESKMTLLRDAIRNVEMQGKVGLSESFRQREKILRQKGFQLDTQAAHQVRHGERVQKETREALIAHSLDVEHLLEELETAFPKYFALKYRQDTPSMDDFYPLVQDSERVLVAYFVHRRVLTMFVLKAGNELQVRQVSLKGKVLEPRFFGDLDWLNRSRQDPGSVWLQQAVSQLRTGMVFEKRDVFLHYAQLLYEKLIGPIEAELESRDVWVIPDGPLAYLPFEVLLSQGPSSSSWDLPYLIKKHAISYAYAASLIDQKASLGESPSYKRGVAFAPAFQISPGVSKAGQSSLPALPHSLTEVNRIRRIFEAHGGKMDLWLEDAAKVETFREVVGQGNYVHLATHAQIDEAFPALSRLHFADLGDAGALYLGDLFGLEMNADLVVLSACETGRGRMIRGEGVMGFVRGLFFAGARRVLVSQWQVGDTSTATFMADFYESTFSGMPIERALRQVKIKQIELGQKPYAWAGFVLHSRMRASGN